MNAKSTGTNTTLLSAHQRKLADVIFNLQLIIQQNLHENVEAQTVMFLMAVANSEEAIDLSAIGQKLSLSKAGASRNFYRLADGKGGEDGLDLIKSKVDYNDRRRVLLVLTPKGTDLVVKLTDYLETHVRRLQDANA